MHTTSPMDNSNGCTLLNNRVDQNNLLGLVDLTRWQGRQYEYLLPPKAVLCAQNMEMSKVAATKVNGRSDMYYLGCPGEVHRYHNIPYLTLLYRYR